MSYCIARFFFFLCFIDPAESAYLRIPPKKLLMPLVYYHEHGVKQKKTGTNDNNGIRFQN